MGVLAARSTGDGRVSGRSLVHPPRSTSGLGRGSRTVRLSGPETSVRIRLGARGTAFRAVPSVSAAVTANRADTNRRSSVGRAPLVEKVVATAGQTARLISGSEGEEWSSR